MAGDDITRDVRLAALCAIVCAVAILAAGGCHGDSSAPPPLAAKPPPTAPAAPAKKGPTPAELTAGMVEAAVQGKAVLPLSLKFELVQRPKVGQPLDINLALIPQLGGGPLTIQVGASDGVDVGAANQTFDLPNVSPGEVYRHTLKVTPTSDGVLVVSVNIALKHDEVTDSSVFSIPIIADR